jgi:RNA polymerase sigma-70 factor (ECF subfamily)
LELVRAGAPEAFRALYYRHVRAVYQYSLSICRSDQMARESTQEVWIALWSSRRRMVWVGDSALPWLLVTCRHKSLNRLAAGRKQPESIESFAVELQSRLHDPVSDAEARALEDHVRLTVAEMSSLDQRIFELCVTEARSYESASRELDISEGALRNRLSRLRQRLRQRIDEFGAES